jgi:hypothetical protein
MQLRVGMRLSSTQDSTRIIILKASQSEAELTCGGRPMSEEIGAANDNSNHSSAANENASELGKRYVHERTGIEVLVTQGGPGILAVGNHPMTVKAPKKLPSSD